MIKANTRELIVDLLLEITEKNAYSHIALKKVLEQHQDMDKQERAFLSKVLRGTLERMLELDYIINQFSKVKVKKMKPVIRSIMRSGVYQLLFMDQVPDSAVCNEAVKLAKKRGFTGLSSFVNGVLRAISRKKEEISYPDEKKEPVYALSIRYSMPEWIILKWLRAYDFQTVEKMCCYFLENQSTSIRCSLHKTNPESLKEELEQQHIIVERSQILPYAFEISGYNYLNDIPQFKEGKFYVQDVSSMLVAEAASPKVGDFCIDVCAAPGGKSLHLAEKLALLGEGRLLSRDLTEKKTNIMKENLKKSGLSCMEVEQWDALKPDESKVKKADIVLADLPCSGLGVIGKKTDIKYKMSEQQTEELAELQRNLLSVVQNYVKENGTLIYSTCTVNEEENEKNAAWFLEHFPFEPISLEGTACAQFSKETAGKGFIQILPGVYKTDGFFIAKFKRIG